MLLKLEEFPPPKSLPVFLSVSQRLTISAPSCGISNMERRSMSASDAYRRRDAKPHIDISSIREARRPSRLPEHPWKASSVEMISKSLFRGWNVSAWQ
jgi:hypothetical protein